MDVEKLEQRLHEMESLLGQLRHQKVGEATSSSSPFPSATGAPLHGRAGYSGASAQVSPKAQPLELRVHDERTQGKSSEIAFLNEVLDVKQSMARRRQNYGFPFSEEIGRALPWEYDYYVAAPSQFAFPEMNLLLSLVELYFTYVDIYFGILHHSTFIRSISENLHLTNSSFAEVVLLVAAVGSRHSDDPEVLLEGKHENWFSSGWKWFSQVRVLPKTLMRVPNLYDLQKICLASVYLFGTSSPTEIWNLAGIGLRFAQERGVHRQKTSDHAWTLEDELWKRAFWMIVVHDRMSSIALGTPLGIREEDFDAELPFEYNDEYWKNLEYRQSFNQPERRSSKHTFLILSIRLSEIVAFAHQTIYANGKFKAFLAKSNPQWKESIVQTIDTALSKWHDSVPEFLRWPSSDASGTFYQQSSTIYLSYHHTRIQTHRPFLPSFIGYSAFSSACLVVCTNASRSCSHIFAVMVEKQSPKHDPYCVTIALTSIIFLLLYIWEGGKYGLVVDPASELQNIRHCLNWLKVLKSHYIVAANFLRVLEPLVSEEEEKIRLKSPSDSTPATGSSKPTPTLGTRAPVQPNNALPAPSSKASSIPENIMDLFRPFTGDGQFSAEYDEIWSQDDLGMENEGYPDPFGSSNSELTPTSQFNRWLAGARDTHIPQSL